MRGLIYLLFFCSGVSGLIYQVVWVRAFGNVFGNTVHSASLVVAVFMVGLGAGSYLMGRWADRRYHTRPDSLLRAYGVVELAIAALGLAISLSVPRLGLLSAWASSYVLDSAGWWVLSPATHAGRAVTAVLVLLPITVLMGGTLTLLIRHLVRGRAGANRWAIAVLYAVNTIGAAAGSFLTDFWLLPAAGLLRTQLLAVGLNAGVGLVAVIASSRAPRVERGTRTARTGRSREARDEREARVEGERHEDDVVVVPLTGVALAMSGFAALGLEIVWFRHFAIQLGGFRTVFSLLLTIILLGIGVGSLVAALLQRSASWGGSPSRAARWLIVIQGLIAASTLGGVAFADVSRIDAALSRVSQAGAPAAFQALTELWFNTAPILMEVGLPALLMGFGFPLANAMIQRAEDSVGRRAGALYFASTAGAVVGSLAAGFVLLPVLGLQRSVTVLALVSAASAIPLFLALRRDPSTRVEGPSWLASPAAALGTSLFVAGASLLWWQRLPAEAIILRALPRFEAGEERLALTEGLTEVVAVTDVAGRGRRLLTNGHSMSTTWPQAQRYMRALAHLPLLSIERPEAALVIGFGVGNTTHAVTLHPSVQHVEVADLSRGVLEHHGYFADANQQVLKDPRVTVFINDGRHHLSMRPAASFDLITLEPPPIAYAGVGALYSREFYALARTRLRPAGYVSQWLPVYQAPGPISLAMIRAFVDVFPDAVLVSGAGSDLLLLGTNQSPLQVDPDVLHRRLTERPAVQADLTRVDLGTVPEIVGTFVGSAATLQEAARGVNPATDDRPVQEYAVRSLFTPDATGLTAVADLGRAADWCPGCFRDGQSVGRASGLDVYLSLLGLAYGAPPSELLRVRDLPPGARRVAGSAYLGATLPDSPAVHNMLGVALASQGDLEPAVEEFRRALALAPGLAETHWHLGAALAARGATGEAIGHLREAVRLMPDSADAHNDLGAVLAREGHSAEAIAQFQRALALRPGDPQAQRNLALATGTRR